MNVNIGDYYEMKLQQILAYGVATNKTEAIRQAILEYGRKLENEEADMVISRIQEDEERWKKSGEKWHSLDDVLKENKLGRKKL